MEQPKGFIKDSSKVWRLRCALYGLKQAGLSWWRACTRSMTQDLGFKCCTSDASVYVYKENGKTVIAVIYIDDALFMGNDKELIMHEFMQCWECQDLGVAQEFFGMHIRHDRSKRHLALDQSSYLKKIIKCFNMTDAKSVQTPLPTGYQPSKHNGPVDPKLCQEYQQLIGSILYLSLGTRADIAYSVAKMSQYSSNPSEDHLNKVYYILRYLVGTQDYELVFDGLSDAGFMAYCDSDWASNIDDQKSHTGMIVQLANGPVSWVSHKQKTIVLSSTEAKYMALSDSCQQLMWLQSLFNEIGISIQPLLLEY